MKQTFNYLLTLLLWGVAIVFGLKRVFPYLFWFLLALHFIELVVTGYRTGRKYGVSAGRSIVMSMIFGFTWWLPLQKQMKAETFDASDFTREG